MKHFLQLVIAAFFLTANSVFAQQVTLQYTAPSSVTIDNVGNYGYTLPNLNFTPGMFNLGCQISDVDVIINWAKTAGSCNSPTGGNSYHNETSFRVNAPSGSQILAVPGTWSGAATTTNVITTFSQGPGIPSGTPVTGTFGPNNGNLTAYNGLTPFGNWNLSAGDNAAGDPLCLVSYSVRIFTATDATPPAITGAPGSITIAAASGQCSAVHTWATPGTTDACGATIARTVGPPSGSTFPVGTTPVTYVATDTYGNTTTHNFSVTVVDGQSPGLNCPANVTAIAPTGSCAAIVSFTTPVATDNCPGPTVAQLTGPTSGSSMPVGTQSASFRATDGSGNTTDCSFTLTVVDIEDPVLTCPANINVVSTTGNCGAVINYTTPVGSDNCPGVLTVLTAGFASGSTFPSGTTTVSYLSTDASSNTESCSFTVTVSPVPNGNMSLSPSPICQGDQTLITFNFTSGTPPYNVSFTDGISTFNVNGVVTGSTYTITPPTSVTYSYTAIQDATGCARTTAFGGTTSVVVTPLPLVSFTGLDAVYCESDANISLFGSQAGGTFFGTGVTNLGAGLGTFSPSAAGPVGPHDVTYTFTDINSCTDTDVQQVLVDEQPVANAGSGGNECDLEFAFAAVPSVGIGTWTMVSGPGVPFFSNINMASSIVQVSAIGAYVFQWSEVNGECSDSDQITVNFYAVPVANAGFGGSECDFDFTFGAIASVGTGTWTASGPGTVVSYVPNANSPNAVVTVDTYGTYTFTWTENNNGCTASANTSVTFEQLPVADAGVGSDQCDLDFTFAAVPSVGNGLWTAVGPGIATFTAANSATSTVTVSNYGTYVFTWTETNGNCVSVDQLTINFYQQPVANAGDGGDVCDLDYDFNGTASVGVGVWTYTGPGTATFDDDSDPATSVTVSVYGAYNFTWTETNGTCFNSESVLVNFFDQPVANAGIGGDACDLDFSLTGVASVGVGLWTASGPGTATFDDDLSAATDVTVSTYGTYTFTWTEISGVCIDAASVTVNFYEQPVGDAGTAIDECDLNALLSANTSVGIGAWSQTGGSGTASFNNPASPTSLVTVDAYDTYEFTWTETNGSCTDAATVSVSFFEQPVANAGAGGQECDLDFDLAAVVSVGTGLWTASGPGTAIYSDDTDANATATVSLPGVYTFTWTETNGSCSDDATVQVSFFDQPLADAGTSVDQCDLNFTFNGVASFGTGTWAYTGPGVAFFSNPNSATASVTVDTYGAYDFTWTEVNGPCSDNAMVSVNFYQQPVADAGTGGAECDLDFDLSGTASVGVGTWTYVGPGNATFAPNTNDPAATVTVDATGQYTFTWTEDNNGCTDSEDVLVDFNPLPTVSFSGLAASYCIDQTTPVPLTGSPSGGSYSGLGISGNSFVPSVAGVGTIFITYTFTDGNGCTNSQEQTVDVNGLPNVSFTGLNLEYCEDDATVYSLVGAPSGGAFSGLGITGDDFIPVSAGDGVHTISYTYTDPFGCTSFDEQDVTVNELPVVSFTGLSASYCENASSANLVGSPTGGTFSGTGIIGAQFSPVSAGVGIHTITYTYTDGNGCTNSTTLDVTVNDSPLPVITPIGTSEICAGQNLTLNAGSGYSVYNWSNGTNGQTTTVNTAGTYNVIVTTAQGCSGTSAAVQVVVNQPPVVALGNDTTICTGSVINLDAGNPGSTYAWSTFEITQTINVTTTGAYTVTVTDGNGCTGSDNIAVSVSNLLDPVIVASGPLTFCNGDSVTLTTGAFDSYLWSTGSANQSVTIHQSGVVELQVWDQFGCSGSDDAIVSVLQLPNAAITPNGTVAICDGDSATLSSVGSFASYSWSPTNESSSSIVVNSAGTYTLTVEHLTNGCLETSDPVEVVVNVTIQPTIVPSGPIEFCDGGSVSLSVAPGPYNSYLWTSGSTTPSIVVTETGDYGITVLDANNCIDSTLLANTIHIEVWDPQPMAAQQGDSVVVTNGPFSTYQWYLNGAPIPGATNEFYLPSVSGNYLCEVTDENGCVATSFNVEFTFTGIFDVVYDYEISLYPNPTNGLFTLEADLGSTMDVVLSFSDITGREIIAPESLSSVSSLRREFDISHLDKGVYYIQLSTSEGMVVKPIVRD